MSQRTAGRTPAKSRRGTSSRYVQLTAVIGRRKAQLNRLKSRYDADRARILLAIADAEAELAAIVAEREALARTAEA